MTALLGWLASRWGAILAAIGVLFAGVGLMRRDAKRDARRDLEVKDHERAREVHRRVDAARKRGLRPDDTRGYRD